MNMKVFILLPLLLLTVGFEFSSAQTLFHMNDAAKPPKPVPSSHHLSKNDPDLLCSAYKDTLSTIILKFLENLRTHMDTGIPSLGIPALDPLQVQNTSFHESKPYQYNVDGTVDNTLVEGLKTFNVTHISTSFFHMQANLSLTIPYFLVTGKYNLHGKLLSVIPVKGNGPYILIPSDLLASVTTQLHLEGGHLQITSMNFLLDMSKLTVKFDGLYGGGHVGTLFNQIMTKWGVSIFHRVEPKIHERLRETLITVINEKLKEISLVDLIGMFDKMPSCKDSIVKMMVTKIQNAP